MKLVREIPYCENPSLIYIKKVCDPVVGIKNVHTTLTCKAQRATILTTPINMLFTRRCGRSGKFFEKKDQNCC